MQKNIVKKGLAIAVIFLFVVVSFQPVLAKDIFSPGKKAETKELLETIINIANDREIQNIIKKFEDRGYLLESQYFKVRLQKEIICAILKTEMLNERIKQLLDLPCNCENPKITEGHPIICILLFPLLLLSIVILVFNPYSEIGGILASCILALGEGFYYCWWAWK